MRYLLILLFLCGCANRIPGKPVTNRRCDQVIEDPEGVTQKQPPQVLELKLEMGVHKITPKENEEK